MGGPWLSFTFIWHPRRPLEFFGFTWIALVVLGALGLLVACHGIPLGFIGRHGCLWSELDCHGRALVPVVSLGTIDFANVHGHDGVGRGARFTLMLNVCGSCGNKRNWRQSLGPSLAQ